MKQILRNNGLSITLLALFLMMEAGLTVAGHSRHNQEQLQHGKPLLSYVEYLGSSEFIEATTENWESEFLQMCAYVFLTTFLYQKGSAESKDPDKREAVDRDPRRSAHKPKVPWPVRKGGLILKLYEHSLSLALFFLFVLSLAWHARSGARQFSAMEWAHGGQPVSTMEYMTASQFWFESLQNWQSEFLSIALMVILSIFLRQRGSPESKPVDAAHDQTGHE